MKKNTIFKTILLAIFMASAMSLFAAKEFTKEINKNFNISDGGKVEIINKYGNVDVRPVDGNEVTFKVEILVEAKNEERANEIFDAIDIDFYDTRDYVKAETSLAGMNKFWKKVKNWGKNNSYEINYYVNAPRHLYLVLNNKYGHIHTEDMDNKMGIELKYGNFTIGSVHDLDVELGYGNGEAAHIQNANITVKYGKISIEKAQNIEVESKYSTIEVGEAREIRSTSKYNTFRLGDLRVFRNEGKYDKFRIENVNDIRVHTKYTDIEVEDIRSNGEFETEYGSLKINDLSSGFQEIDITSKYTGIRIDSQEDAAFSYHIETEYADLKVPHYTEYKEDGSEKWVKASKNGGSNSRIIVKAKYGHVKIR